MIPRDWWPDAGKAIRYGAWTGVLLGLPVVLFASDPVRHHIAGIVGWFILFWLLVGGSLLMALLAWMRQRGRL